MHEVEVLLGEGFQGGAVLPNLVKLIDPSAANRQHLSRPLATISCVQAASVAIGVEHALDDRGRQSGRRNQHPSAQHAGPMH